VFRDVVTDAAPVMAPVILLPSAMQASNASARSGDFMLLAAIFSFDSTRSLPVSFHSLFRVVI
jgi:hypothetical protein